jgi:hypothetical protein
MFGSWPQVTQRREMVALACKKYVEEVVIGSNLGLFEGFVI